MESKTQNQWKVVGVLTILLLSAVIYVFNVNLRDKAETHNNKIGAILPLSGPAGKMGEEVLQSIKLADLYFVDLRVEDDQCSGKNALSAYEKLNAEGVDVFYIACSGSVMSVYPRARENGDLILTAYAGSTEIRKTDDTVIRFIPDGLSIANEMVDYLNQGAVSGELIYLVYENIDYSKSVADVISQNIKEGVGVMADTYKSQDTDFKSLVLRIKQSGTKKFVFVPGSDTAFKLFLIELQKNNVKGEIIGDVNVCDYPFATSDFGIPSVCWKSSLSDLKTKQYEDSFELKWNTKSNYTFYNAVTTDIFSYLGELISQNGLNIDKIKKTLIRGGYKGAYGAYNFTTDGETADSKQYLVKSRR